MTKLLGTAGLVIGIAGLLLSLVAGLGRVSGNYYIMGYQSLTLLNAGVALMVASCMVKLYNKNG